MQTIRRATLRKKPLIAMAGIVVAGSLAACSSGGDAASSNATTPEDASRNSSSPAAKYQANGITVGIVNYPPLATVDASGKAGGFLPELTMQVLKNLGIKKVTVRVTTFDGVVPGLAAGQWDLAAAALFPTAERCKSVLFSNPTFVFGHSIMVKRGNPLSLHGASDAKKNPKAKVVVLSGGSNLHYVMDAGVPKSQIHTAPDVPTAIQALKVGRANAYFEETESIADKVPSEFELVDDKERGKDATAVGFKASDKEFRDVYNKQLKQLIEDGSYGDLYERTLGKLPQYKDYDLNQIKDVSKKSLYSKTPSCLR